MTNKLLYMRRWRKANPTYNRDRMRLYRSIAKIYDTPRELKVVKTRLVELLGVRVRADYLRVLRKRDYRA